MARYKTETKIKGEKRRAKKKAEDEDKKASNDLKPQRESKSSKPLSNMM